MRAYLPSYEMKPIRNLTEALLLLKDEPGVWRPFAGGTDLMVLLEAGKLAHRKFFNIWGLKELKEVTVTSDHVMLGALTTYGELQEIDVLKKEFPLLCHAAKETGAIAIQNRGTLGGNIANASPAADSPPALLVYEAEVELVSTAGARWVRYLDFHLGYKRTVMGADELISRIRIPRGNAGAFQYYRKVGTRKAQAISKICFAGMGSLKNGVIQDVRIALGSVAPTAIRCSKTEAYLKGKKLDSHILSQARTQIENEVAPIDDIRSTAEFRSTVTGNLLEEFLEKLSTHVELD